MKTMKTIMKMMISLVTAVVLTLAFVPAYAANDEMPDMNTNAKDTGSELYEAFLKHETDVAKGSASGGVRAKEASRADEYTNDEMPKFPGR